MFDTRTFLRWAGANILLGSWDNYFATPSNYYLYNSAARCRRSMQAVVHVPAVGLRQQPRHRLLGQAWQYTDLLDWAANSATAHTRQRRLSRIPLVRTCCANRSFCPYYLDHLEHLLDTAFAPTP